MDRAVGCIRSRRSVQPRLPWLAFAATSRDNRPAQQLTSSAGCAGFAHDRFHPRLEHTPPMALEAVLSPHGHRGL